MPALGLRSTRVPPRQVLLHHSALQVEQCMDHPPVLEHVHERGAHCLGATQRESN